MTTQVQKALSLSVVAAMLVACADQAMIQATAWPGESAPSRAWIGPQGGRIEIPGEAFVEVPAGALDSPVEIHIERCGDDESLISPVYCFEPDGLGFAVPVVVGLRVRDLLPRPLRHVRVVTRHETRWHAFAASRVDERGYAVAATPHFSDYGALLAEPGWVASEGNVAQRAEVEARCQSSCAMRLHAHPGMVLVHVDTIQDNNLAISGLSPASTWHIAFDQGVTSQIATASQAGLLSLNVPAGRHFVSLLTRPGTQQIVDQASCENLLAFDSAGTSRAAEWTAATGSHNAICRLPTVAGFALTGSISIARADLDFDCGPTRVLASATPEQVGITLGTQAYRSRLLNCQIQGFEVGALAQADGQQVLRGSIEAGYAGIAAAGSRLVVNDNQIATGGDFGLFVYSPSDGEVIGNVVNGQPLVAVDVLAFPESVAFTVAGNKVDGAGLAAIRVNAVLPHVDNNDITGLGASLIYDFASALGANPPQAPDSTSHKIFHNNFLATDAAGYQLVASAALGLIDPTDLRFSLEASHQSQGNFWGTEGYFLPGVMSNHPQVKDSFAYCRRNAWLDGEAPLACATPDQPPDVQVSISATEGTCLTEFVVDVRATTDDRDPAGSLRFDYDFGDGTLVLNTSELQLSHLYRAVGQYQITITARDSSGNASALTSEVSIGALKPEIFSARVIEGIYGYRALHIGGEDFAVTGYNAPDATDTRFHAQVIFRRGLGQDTFSAERGIRLQNDSFIETNASLGTFGSSGRYIVRVDNPGSCGDVSEPFILRQGGEDADPYVTSVSPNLLLETSDSSVIVSGGNFILGDRVHLVTYPGFERIEIPAHDIQYFNGAAGVEVPDSLMFRFRPGTAVAHWPFYVVSVGGSITHGAVEAKQAGLRITALSTDTFFADLPQRALHRDQILISGEIDKNAPGESVIGWIGSFDRPSWPNFVTDFALEQISINLLSPTGQVVQADIPGRFRYRIGLTIPSVDAREWVGIQRSTSISADVLTRLHLDPNVIVVPIAFHRVRSFDDSVGTSFPDDPQAARDLVDSVLGMSSSIDRQERVALGSTPDQIFSGFYDLERRDNIEDRLSSDAVNNFGQPRCDIVFTFHSLDTVFVAPELAQLVGSNTDGSNLLLNTRETPGAIDVFIHDFVIGESADVAGFADNWWNTHRWGHRKLVVEDSDTNTADADIRQVLSHEIGHTFGLRHVKRNEDLLCIQFAAEQLHRANLNVMMTASLDDDLCVEHGETPAIPRISSNNWLAIDEAQCQQARRYACSLNGQASTQLACP